MVKIESMRQFKIEFKDGQTIIIDLEEAEQLRDYLNDQIPSDIKTDNPVLRDANVILRPKPRIPEDYNFIFDETTIEKDGIPSITYNFYRRNNTTDWIVEVKREYILVETLRLGRLLDPKSSLGKLLIQLPPQDVDFNTKWIRERKIITNPRRIKSCLHVLEFEKCIVRIIDDSKGDGFNQPIMYVITPRAEDLKQKLRQLENIDGI